MVYRLSTMRNRTKIAFFILIWIFSALCAVVGTIFISTAVILPQTPYEIQENEIVSQIREEMGQWIGFSYFDQDATTAYYHNITIQFIEGRLQAIDIEGKIIPEFKLWKVEENRENGMVFYIQETGVLTFLLFNNTAYEVKIKHPEFLWIEVFPSRRLSIRYQPGEEFSIVQRYYDEIDQREIVLNRGTYFIVKNRPILEWITKVVNTIWENFFDQFTFVARTLLYTVAIGGGAGIITAFVLIITRISRLFSGKFWTYQILKSLNGKLGKIIGLIPFFDFNGEFFVEERFIDIIDLSSSWSTFKELFRQRWYDMIFFPTALAAIITIVFVQSSKNDKLAALVWSPILSPIVLIFLLLYFPTIWAYNEGGFKRMEISPQGDIIAVKPLGKILREGIGIIVGFSGILSLGALATEITQSVAGQPTTTGQINVAGFTLDLFGLLLLILWTIGLFLVLLGSIIVGASLLAINYLQTSHLKNIEYLRQRSDKDKLITNWGSVTYQFTPMPKETIYVKDDKEPSL